MKACLFLAATVVLMGSLGCGEKGDDTQASATPPTWYSDIQPMIGEHCQSCHSDTDNFTFALTDYETVSGLAPILLDKMEGSTEPPYQMPPFAHQESEECEDLGVWRDDYRLSEEQLIIFGEWIDAGTPEGDPANAVEFQIPQTEVLEGEGITRYSTTGVTIPAGEFEDQYICFTIDPELEEDSWFDGIEIHPGNADVVHHVVIFTDPNG